MYFRKHELRQEVADLREKIKMENKEYQDLWDWNISLLLDL